LAQAFGSSTPSERCVKELGMCSGSTYAAPGRCRSADGGACGTQLRSEAKDVAAPPPRLRRISGGQCVLKETQWDYQRAWSSMSRLGRNDDLDDCVVCLGALVDAVRVGCGHLCCDACLKEFEASGLNSPLCPLCQGVPGDEPGGEDAERLMTRETMLMLQAQRAPPGEGKDLLWEKALRCLRNVVDTYPQNARAMARLGVVLQHQGDSDGAIALFRRALEVEPRLAQAHFNLGVLMQDFDDFEAALRSYEAAIELNPRFARGHNNMGIVRRRRGDLPGAIAAFRKAYTQDPTLLTAVHNLGAGFLAQGDRESARAAFRTVLVESAVGQRPQWSR